MIDVKKLRKLKGRRIYQFWLDEETGDITDVTSRDDVIQVIYCKDCKYSDTFNDMTTEPHWQLKCLGIRYGGVEPMWYCEHGERKEE